MLLLSSCATQKRAKPCAQCPQYTKFSPLFLDKVKLNPYPHEIALQTKYDK
jgi:hypothetical protein